MLNLYDSQDQASSDLPANRTGIMPLEVISETLTDSCTNINIEPMFCTLLCSICLNYITFHNRATICDKRHYFCSECLLKHIYINLKYSKMPKCPYEECYDYTLDKSTLFGLLSYSDQAKIFRLKESKRIAGMNNLRLCSKETCPGVLDLSCEDVHCSKCDTYHCGKCIEPKHRGPCDKGIARKLQRRDKYRRCWMCRRLVYKNRGCNHITCICGNQFCYLCGKSYYSGHKCYVPSGLNYLYRIRWQIEHQETRFECNCLSMSKILSFLYPDLDLHYGLRAVYLVLFTVLLYPLIFAIMTLTIISAAVVYDLVVILQAILYYFLILPGKYFCRLQLWPSIKMRQCRIHRFIIRLLLIPLLPLYIVCGIIEYYYRICHPMMIKSLICDPLKLLRFVVLMPCLMLKYAQIEY